MMSSSRWRKRLENTCHAILCPTRFYHTHDIWMYLVLLPSKYPYQVSYLLRRSQEGCGSRLGDAFHGALQTFTDSTRDSTKV